MCLSLYCVYLAGHVRRSVYDTLVPRETVNNTAYSKPRGVTAYLGTRRSATGAEKIVRRFFVDRSRFPQLATLFVLWTSDHESQVTV